MTGLAVVPNLFDAVHTSDSSWSREYVLSIFFLHNTTTEAHNELIYVYYIKFFLLPRQT